MSVAGLDPLTGYTPRQLAVLVAAHAPCLPADCVGPKQRTINGVPFIFSRVRGGGWQYLSDEMVAWSIDFPSFDAAIDGARAEGVGIGLITSAQRRYEATGRL